MKGSYFGGIFVLLFLLSGCSTATFEKPTAAFADGLASTKSAFETLSETERKAYITSQMRRALQPGNSLLISEKCGVSDSKPAVGPSAQIDCAPIVYDGTEHRVEFQPAAPHALKYVTVVAEYGKGLSTLAAAKDISELKDAVGKSTAAAAALASTFTGPAVGAAVGAGLNFLTWVVGMYLDYERLDALLHIVEQADPSIAKAETALSEIAIRMQASIVAKRAADIRLEVTALALARRSGADPAKIEEKAQTLIDDALSLQQYAKSDVAAPFIKMRQAHAELLKSLRHPRADPDAAFKALGDFVKSADDLRTAAAKLGGKK